MEIWLHLGVHRFQGFVFDSTARMLSALGRQVAKHFVVVDAKALLLHQLEWDHLGVVLGAQDLGRSKKANARFLSF